MSLLHKKVISKPTGKFIGAYVSDKLSSHLTLFTIAQNITKTEFIQNAFEEKLSKPSVSIHVLSEKIVKQLIDIDPKCSGETKENIAFELLKKGVDKETVDKILRLYEKNCK